MSEFGLNFDYRIEGDKLVLTLKLPEQIQEGRLPKVEFRVIPYGKDKDDYPVLSFIPVVNPRKIGGA